MRGVDLLRSPARYNLADFPSNVLQTYYASGEPGKERVSLDFLGFATGGYAGNSIVWSVISARMRLFSEARFQYRNLKTKAVFGTGDLGVLENPWPNGTTGELLARMLLDVDLAGNAFVRLVDGRLERLRPDWVTIVSVERDGYREILGYAYEADGITAQPDFFDVDEVAHWSPYPDPLAQFRGISWLTPVVREINADIAMSVHKQRFFDNAATPNLVVKYQQPLGEEKAKKILGAIEARHQGAMQAYKTMVLDSAADVTVVGSDFQQMAFTALQSAGEARIASAAGTPPIVAGLQAGLDASTYSNYGLALRNFADTTMHSLWRGVCAALSKLVEVPADSELWFDTRDIPALRDAERDRQEANQFASVAAANLVNTNWEPESIKAFLASGDFAQLKHTGLLTVQQQQGEKQDPAPEGQPRAVPPTINVDARTFVETAPVTVDARTDVANPDDLLEVLREQQAEIVSRLDTLANRRTTKHVERDERGDIVRIIEEND